MNDEDQMTITGEVIDIFAQRFDVKTATGTVLADLGPKGAEQVHLKKGEHVELAGEMKPSELKVRSIALSGAPPVLVDHHKKPRPHEHEHEHDDADPKSALETAEANGFRILGQPRRKPKHFEILGRDAAGDLVELHVQLDGLWRDEARRTEDRSTRREDPRTDRRRRVDHAPVRDGCITVHTDNARRLGATQEESAEALGVPVSVNAGAVIVYFTRILDAYAGSAEDARQGEGARS